MWTHSPAFCFFSWIDFIFRNTTLILREKKTAPIFQSYVEVSPSQGVSAANLTLTEHRCHRRLSVNNSGPCLFQPLAESYAATDWAATRALPAEKEPRCWFLCRLIHSRRERSDYCIAVKEQEKKQQRHLLRADVWAVTTAAQLCTLLPSALGLSHPTTHITPTAEIPLFLKSGSHSEHACNSLCGLHLQIRGTNTFESSSASLALQSMEPNEYLSACSTLYSFSQRLWEVGCYRQPFL